MAQGIAVDPSEAHRESRDDYDESNLIILGETSDEWSHPRPVGATLCGFMNHR